MYSVDVGGNENAQLYYQRLGEPAKMLTDGKSRNGAPLWSNSGHEVAFFTNARDGRHYDINIVDPESGSLPRLVFAGDDSGAEFSVLDWSPDDGKILVRKYLSISEAYLYIVDLSSGQKREVESSPPRPGLPGRNSRVTARVCISFRTATASSPRLNYVNLFTNEKTVVSSHVPWDIEELAISRDGHYLAYVSNEAGAEQAQSAGFAQRIRISRRRA